MIPLARLAPLVIALALPALPALAPAAPALPIAAAVLKVTPQVRRIIRDLRLIDIPREWRGRNWTGRRGQGSCVHASLVHLLHWQGRHELAGWWKARFGDGEDAEGLARKLQSAGLAWAETRVGDERFLEWAIRTRRGAAVVVHNGSHMVNLVGLDRTHAQILDSNSPHRVQAVARETFLRDWKQSGGWAVTVVGPPPPPDPWIVKNAKESP